MTSLVMQRVRLYVLICLITNCMLVSSLPSILQFNGGIHALHDKNLMKSDSADPEYVEDLYGVTKKASFNRLLSFSDRVNLRPDGPLSEANTDLHAAMFDENNQLRQQSNDMRQLYDFSFQDDGDLEESFVKVKLHTLRSYKENILKLLFRRRGQEIQNDVVNWRDLDMQPSTGDETVDIFQPVDKRQYVRCDISQMTVNMLLEYFKYRTICGRRTSKVRFGLGK